jgi:hypothetical protein
VSAERRPHIIKVETIAKRSLLGLVDVEFSGLRLKRLPVIRSKDGPSVGLPRVAVIGLDGVQRRNAVGKPEFESLIEWTNGESSDRSRRPC